MDNTLYRHYYKIPTATGCFYLYREYLNRGWDNVTGGTYYEYNDFMEFFTGLVVTQHTNLIDLRVEKDKKYFETIREELIKLDYESIDNKLRYSDILSYRYMTFEGSYKSNNYSFANKPNYNNKLPYRDSRFIITLDSCFNPAYNKFNSPDYDYYRLNINEFADEIKLLIGRYGSKEEVAKVVLERIKKQALICKENDEYISNQLNNDPKKTIESEEYIKKLLY